MNAFHVSGCWSTGVHAFHAPSGWSTSACVDQLFLVIFGILVSVDFLSRSTLKPIKVVCVLEVRK